MSPRRAGLIDTAFLVLVAVIVRLPSLALTVIDPDEDAFAIAGRELARGFLPYTTFFDIKPPGSTLLVGALFALTGPSLVAIRLLGLACVAASAVLLRGLAARAGWNRPLAFAAGALYIGFATSLHGLATMTEIMLAPFTIGAVLLLWRMSEAKGFGARLLLAAGAGLSLGGAVLIKLVPLAPGGLIGAAVGLWMLVRGRRPFLEVLVLGAVYGLFAAAPMAASAAVFAAAHLLKVFVYANYGFVEAYKSVGVEPRQAFRELVKVAAELWPLLMLATLGILRAAMSLRAGVPKLTIVALAWLAGELVASLATGHFYNHYFLMLLPPLCLLAVEGARALHDGLGVRDARAATALACAAALVPAMPYWIRTAPSLVGQPDVFERTAAVINQAAADHKPTLWVANQDLLSLYVLTGADIPTPYAQAVQLIGDQNVLIRDEPAAEVLRILRSRPEFVVVNRDVPFPTWAGAIIEPELADHYRPYQRVKDFYVLDLGVTRRYEFQIYRRVEG